MKLIIFNDYSAVENYIDGNLKSQNIFTQRNIPGIYSAATENPITINQFERLLADNTYTEKKKISSRIELYIIKLLLKKKYSRKTAEYKYFYEMYLFNGFAEKIRDLLRLLKKNGLTSAKFREIINSKDKKQNELAEIFYDYECFLENRSLIDSAEIRAQILEITENMPNDISFLKNVEHIYLQNFLKFDFFYFSLFYNLSAVLPVTISFPLPDKQKAKCYSFVEYNISKFEKLGVTENDRKLELDFAEYNQNEALNYICDNLFEKNTEEEPPPSFADSFEINKAANMSAEINLLAAKIRYLIDNAVMPENIIIFIPHFNSYIDFIDSVFKNYSIPVKFDDAQIVKNIAGVNFILTFYKIAVDGFPRKQLLEFILNSYMSGFWGCCNKYELFNFLQRKLEKNKSLRIPPDLLKKIIFDVEKKNDSKKNNLPENIEKRKIINEKILLFADLLTDFDKTAMPIEHLEKLKLFIEQIDLKNILRNDVNNKQYRKDLKALDEFIFALDEFCAEINDFGNNEKITVAEFYELLVETAEAVQINFYAPSIPAVRVYYYDEAVGKKAEYVFAPGLNDSSFPAKFSEDPLLSDEEKKYINNNYKNKFVDDEGMHSGKLIFQNAKITLFEDKFIFYSIIRAAREKIFFSYPLIDNLAKQSQISPYLNEIIKISGIKIDVSDACNIYDYKSYKLKLIGEAFEFFDDKNFSKKELKENYKFFARIDGFKKVFRKNYLENKRNKFFNKLTDADKFIYTDEFNGKIKFQLNILDKSISVSAAETAANCPFSFFCAQILKFSDSKELSETPDSAEFGILLHKILERFLAQINDKKFPEKNVLEIFIEEEANAYFKTARINDEPVKKILLKTVFSYLNAFYDFEKENFDAKPISSVKTEYWFENIEFQNIKLRGKIDRVDFFDDSTLSVYDYKTAKKNTIKNYLNKKNFEIYHLQFPLYYNILKILFGNYQINDNSGFYIIGNNPEKVNVKITDSSKLSETMDYLSKIFNQQKFLIKPNNCDYCKFNAVCRINYYKF